MKLFLPQKMDPKSGSTLTEKEFPEKLVSVFVAYLIKKETQSRMNVLCFRK